MEFPLIEKNHIDSSNIYLNWEKQDSNFWLLGGWGVISIFSNTLSTDSKNLNPLICICPFALKTCQVNVQITHGAVCTLQNREWLYYRACITIYSQNDHVVYHRQNIREFCCVPDYCSLLNMEVLFLYMKWTYSVIL